MKSIIFSTASRYLFPLMIIFSFFLLLRGHNEPGGGFVGGLVASTAYVLFALANSVQEAKKLLKINPLPLIGIGLMTALFSGLAALIKENSFMTSYWLDGKFPLVGKLGTPIIFDIGVYLLVVGVTLLIIFTLAEEVN